MALGRFEHYVSIDVEREPGFRQEVLPSIRAGLQAIAAVQFALGAFLLYSLWPHAGLSVLLMPLGLATVALTRVGRATDYGAWVALATVWAAVAVLSGGPEHDYIAVGQTMLVLTAAGVMPLQPIRALSLGLGAHAICVAWIPAAADRHAYFAILTVLSTVIAAARAVERRTRFLSHVQAMKENEILSTAQLRAQLSENAVSVARLAAALTHEVNSPLGALRSSVDTLLSVTTRCTSAGPEERERLLSVQQDLQQSVQDSASRLQSVIVRLRRFSEVEQSDLQQAQLNELISDAALRLEEDVRGRGVVDFQFQDVPQVICRPPQLTTVFSNLLSNALNALNGNGRVLVTTDYRNNQVEVAIRDNGRGMSGEELDHIFDPGFRVQGSRVSTGNWSLFSTRQIIYEHGGDISIDSAPGVGTTVRILLPA
jgi:signal transduction histidine kinase